MIKIIFNETELQQMQNKMREYFQTHWKIFLAEGIFLIVLGTLAILIPQFFTKKYRKAPSFRWGM